MKSNLVIIIHIFICSFFASHLQASDRVDSPEEDFLSLAATPPMGWNS